MAESLPTYADARLAVINVLELYRNGSERSFGRQYVLEQAEQASKSFGQGVDLAGKDIDHIVPRSLGGADNPGNYRIISAHENRSLGATWNEEKCLAVGETRCARAVATSHECGSLRGIGF